MEKKVFVSCWWYACRIDTARTGGRRHSNLRDETRRDFALRGKIYVSNSGGLISEIRQHGFRWLIWRHLRNWKNHCRNKPYIIHSDSQGTCMFRRAEIRWKSYRFQKLIPTSTKWFRIWGTECVEFHYLLTIKPICIITISPPTETGWKYSTVSSEKVMPVLFLIIRCLTPLIPSRLILPTKIYIHHQLTRLHPLGRCALFW